MNRIPFWITFDLFFIVGKLQAGKQYIHIRHKITNILMSKIRKYFFINQKYIVVPCQDAAGTNFCNGLIKLYTCEGPKVKENCEKSCKECVDRK